MGRRQQPPRSSYRAWGFLKSACAQNCGQVASRSFLIEQLSITDDSTGTGYRSQISYSLHVLARHQLPPSPTSTGHPNATVDHYGVDVLGLAGACMTIEPYTSLPARLAFELIYHRLRTRCMGSELFLAVHSQLIPCLPFRSLFLYALKKGLARPWVHDREGGGVLAAAQLTCMRTGSHSLRRTCGPRAFAVRTSAGPISAWSRSPLHIQRRCDTLMAVPSIGLLPAPMTPNAAVRRI